MHKILITLTAYNMGPEATEADFDRWANHVTAYIEGALGLCAGSCGPCRCPSVEVDQHPFRGGPADDTISGATEGQAEEIRIYLESTGWEWCASSEAA